MHRPAQYYKILSHKNVDNNTQMYTIYIIPIGILYLYYIGVNIYVFNYHRFGIHTSYNNRRVHNSIILYNTRK